MTDPLQPSPTALVKIGSALIHAEEFMGPRGHEFDKASFDQLMADVDVVEWLDGMNAKGLLPLKRTK